MLPKKSPAPSPLYLLAVELLVLTIILVVSHPLPVNASLDFSQFYIDLFGILRGDGIYDQIAHSSRYATSTVTEPIVLNPPAYPPWYYILFLPLGAFSLDTSSQIWAWCNIFMFAAAIMLLTKGLTPRIRALIAILAMCSAPFIGHVVIGQQTIILALGLALILASTKRQSALLVAGGLLLLTFKPHLGIPLAGAILAWIIVSLRILALPTITYFLAGLSILALASLLADSHALFDYPNSLVRLSALSINQVCDTCSSLTLTIHQTLPIDRAHLWLGRFGISIVVGIVLMIPLLFSRLSIAEYISASTCAVLLAAPYIRNYDYVLLFAPLLALIREELLILSTGAKHCFLRQSLCVLGFVIAGIIPLFAARQSHTHFLWLSAACVYLACILGKKATTRAVL